MTNNQYGGYDRVNLTQKFPILSAIEMLGYQAKQCSSFGALQKWYCEITPRYPQDMLTKLNQCVNGKAI